MTATARNTVLIVDDEEMLRELMAELLRGLGYRVLEARDGADALERVGRHEGRIDLLVTDLDMPRVNGDALARRLRAARPSLKVLFLSGNPEEGTHGGAGNGVAFLGKPFPMSELAAQVRALLAHAGGPR